MDQEDEYGGLFLVSVDDLGAPGLWASTKDLLESRSVLHGLVLRNKLGRAVTVDRLALQLVPSGDKRLQRLRPFAHSPVVWFRHPYAHLLLVSTLNTAEYRSVLKPALKRAIADLERDWGGPPLPGPPPPQPSGMGALLGGSGAASAAAAAPAGMLGAEWFIVYVRPAEVDVADKAARKVFDKLKDDFSSRGRTRVIRIDPPKGYSAAAVAAVIGASGAAGGGGGGGSWANLRGAGAGAGAAGAGASSSSLPHPAVVAYPGFLPSAMLGLEDLELVKDSLALLLEGCGLHTEAYKE